MTLHHRPRRIFASNQKVEQVAQEIRRYVARKKKVAETAEGFASWWLPQQRFEESVEVVRAALEYLVTEGVLEKRLSGKQEIYMKAG